MKNISIDFSSFLFFQEYIKLSFNPIKGRIARIFRKIKKLQKSINFNDQFVFVNLKNISFNDSQCIFMDLFIRGFFKDKACLWENLVMISRYLFKLLFRFLFYDVSPLECFHNLKRNIALYLAKCLFLMTIWKRIRSERKVNIEKFFFLCLITWII